MVFYHLVSLLDVSPDDLRTYGFISYGKCPLYFLGRLAVSFCATPVLLAGYITYS